MKKIHYKYIKLLIVVGIFVIFFHNILLAKDVVRVGMFQNKPLSFSDEQGEAHGIYPDIIKEIARIHHWKVEFVVDTWSKSLESLKDSNIDLMVSIVYSKERDKIFDFSKEPVVTAWGQVYSSQNSGIFNILDLEGKTVAVMERDNNAKNFLELIEKFNLKINLVKANTYDDVCSLIISKKVDAGVINNINGEFLKRQYGIFGTPIMFSPVTAVFAAPEDKHHNLLDTIDSTLVEWRKDKDSIYYDFMNEWFGITKVEFRFPYRLVASIVSFVLGILILLFFWTRVLSKQVKKRTKALSDSEAHLRTVIETIPDLIWLKDPDGVYLSCNLKFERFFGAKQDQIVGKTDYDFVDKELADFFRNKDREAMASDKPMTNEEEVTYADDGHREILETVKMPMYSTDGSLIGVLGIARDITRRKRMEQERKDSETEKSVLEERLRQSHKMEAIGTLAGGIAHDFNNILFPISGYVEMLIEDLEDDHPSLEFLNRINVGVSRSRELVKQILMVSRQAEGEKSIIRIQTVLKEVIKLSRSSIPTTIDIIPSIDDKCSPVFTDPTQIHQIAMNLITNAYHAMEPDIGILGVSLKEKEITYENSSEHQLKPGKYTCLEISDTGSGIDSQIVEKIFDPYFTTKKKGKGTGLGLSIVYGIVQSYGGNIQVKSVPGEKTSFAVFLPCADDKSDEQKVETSNKISGGNERILVVDDEEAIVLMLSETLIRRGYTVTAETISEKALELFRSQPDQFDLVITDMTMPHITGDQLTKEMRKIRENIPIIICTGYSDQIDDDIARDLAIDAFLIKPVKTKKLCSTIRQVFYTSKQNQGIENLKNSFNIEM